MATLITGLENLLNSQHQALMGHRIGLITNQSGVTADLVPSAIAIQATGLNITTLFSPEHGYGGTVADGKEIDNSTDSATGLPVCSLYGDNRKPTTEMLSNVDTILFDIQDVGCRFYTYLSTMALSMQACAANGKNFVVLDRPNPIGGIEVEGPVLNPRFASFVGMYPIPIRYGMTIGEVARLLNTEFGINAHLEVIPLINWKREMWFEDTGLPWIAPSPAMPTVDTTAVYPGTCLLEGTNVSEGRGTAAPFLTFGAPWIVADDLAHILNSTGLPGVLFTATEFIPTASKYSGEHCNGIAITITDRTIFSPVITGVKIVEIVRRMYPADFAFRGPEPESKHFFDLLAGTDQIRLGLEAGRSTEDLASEWSKELSEFENIRKRCMIY